MRGSEDAGPQAIGAADTRAHRRRAALAVRASHHHGDALQPCAIDTERFQQCGHAREANAIAVFRQVEHYSNPMAEKARCQIFRIRPPRLESSSRRIDGLELTSMISIASGLPPMLTNRSMAA